MTWKLIIIDDHIEEPTLQSSVDAMTKWAKEVLNECCEYTPTLFHTEDFYETMESVMPARAVCKFCNEVVGISKRGNLYAHGYPRDKHGVARLDKVCRGSRMNFRQAVTEPVNDIKPCGSCGMPVVIAMGDFDGKEDELLCPLCLLPVDKDGNDDICGKCGRPTNSSCRDPEDNARAICASCV